LGGRLLVIPIVAGLGLGLAACAGGAATGPNAAWYRHGYNFGVDERGSPSVQADSPTQFCNAALRTAAAAGSAGPSGLASPAAQGPGTHPTAVGTGVPANVPPVSDAAADGAWLTGCVAGLTSE
jgi:hypothetical protein